MNDDRQPTESSPPGEELLNIPGDRGTMSAPGVRSVQSRVSSALALVVFGGLAVGALAWYYSSVLARSHRGAIQQSKTVEQQAQGEANLPPPGLLAKADQTPGLGAQIFGAAPPDRERKPRQSRIGTHAISSARLGAEKSPVERQLGGPVIVRASSAGQGLGQSALNQSYRAAPSGQGPISLDVEAETTFNEPTELREYLHSTSTKSARAHRLDAERLLLSKGTTVDCTLLTAIDSTLPGFTKCVTSTDTWSADGSVVLLDRGSQLIGETRSDVQNGKNRLFIIWSEARTPDGVVVPLESPGTDALGRAGVTGQIDRHFWARFGSAVLVSLIDGAVQGLANTQSRGGVVVNPSSSRDVVTEVLRDNLRIRPTLRKNQGEQVAVMVARDLDFRGVYALTPR